MRYKLCDSDFWNANSTWYTNQPRLSQCFQDTVLVWFPVSLFFLVCLPVEVSRLRRCKRQGLKEISKNWLNTSRITILILLMILKAIESVYHISLLYSSVLSTESSEYLQPALDKHTSFIVVDSDVLVISTFMKPIVQLLTLSFLLVIYVDQRKLGRHTSGPVWAYLFVQLACSATTFLSTILGDELSRPTSHLEISVDYYLEVLFFALLIVLFILECTGDTPNISRRLYEVDSVDGDRPLPPELSASFFSSLTLWWYTSFLWYGYKNQLKVSVLWRILADFRSSHLSPIFQSYWKRTKTTSRVFVDPSLTSQNHQLEIQNTNDSSNKQAYYRCSDGSLQRKNKLWLVLLQIIWPELLISAFLKLMHDILQFTTPMAFKRVLAYMNAKPGEEPLWHGVFFASCLLLIPTIQSLFSAHYFCTVQKIGLNVKAISVGAIYRKSLLLGKSSRQQSTTGEIINLMAVDSYRLQDLLMYLNLLWSAPFQISIAVWLLYNELGWPVFAGLALMLLIGPLNALIIRKIKLFQIKIMKTKDERIKSIGEILNGIKVIKLYAWENSFMNNIFKYRSRELDLLRRSTIYDAMQNFVWTTSPFFVALITFTVYLTFDGSNELTASKAFVSISLFNLLRFPLAMLPALITSLVLALTSMRRITKFLNLDELVKYVTRNNELDAITVEDGTVSWFAPNEDTDGDNSKNKKSMRDTTTKGSTTADRPTEQPKLNSDTHTLKNISMHIKEGSLVAIVGQVASGKSSLLAAMLGEMHRTSGRFNIARDKRIAYVPQQAWIQNLSIINNILFSQRFDEDLYRQTVSVCALQPDFDSFPDGDNSEVGESGLNLSGGQKQRVSLARAVYSQSDIYLFDDPLSALDSHIAKHVFDKVISSTSGMLRKTTRVLATNSLFVLPHVDYIYVLDGGKIVESGTYDELLKVTNGRLAETMRERQQITATSSNVSTPLAQKTSDTHNMIKRTRSISRSNFDSQSQGSSILSEHHIEAVEHVADDDDDITADKQNENKHSNDGHLIDAERLETGGVNFGVYLKYFKAVSLRWVSLVICTSAAAAIFNVATNFWLSTWTSDKTKASSNMKSTNLIVYACLGGLQCLSTLTSGLSLARGAVRGASRLHAWLLTSIMHSPTTTFFDTTPIGRIVNRFAKDIDVVDTTLPTAFRSVLDCFMSILSTIFVIVYSIPVFLILVVPMGIFYALVQRIFIVTTRQLKRLESITRSPIYSNFGETLSGISVIRAFNCEDRFTKKADNLLDTNQTCAYPNVIANRWLSIRLEFTGNLISSLVALYSVLNKSNIAEGLVGLSIIYCLSITQTLSWLVRMSSDLETNVVSVERILEYMANEPEDDWTKPSFTKSRGANWPTDGTISFVDYSTRYRKETSLVLKEISFDVKSCEKIGIVGRTGSGKSSLSLALFRILEPSAGRIIIDGANIADCGLHDLRSRLTIIPQDAVLFSGTLRFNLDPLQLYSDEQIWRALELSHLKAYVSNLNDGLEYKVSEYGDNFSHGQRQLVCLARAVLRNSKIIILDEATAAVDVETDELIQKTIRKQFKQSTILTIAHRLETILDSDRILVLDSGRVCEMDSPLSLAANRESIFASLIRAAGINQSKVESLQASKKSD